MSTETICLHIQGYSDPGVTLVVDPAQWNPKYYVPFAFCPLCGFSYAAEKERLRIIEEAEECEECDGGKLLCAPGGGVKCNKCIYWFCF